MTLDESLPDRTIGSLTCMYGRANRTRLLGTSRIVDSVWQSALGSAPARESCEGHVVEING